MFIQDDVVAEGNNGTFTDGKRYFTCCKGHGLFRPLKRLQIDHRFDDTLEEEPTTESSACVERSAETVDDHISGLMSTLRTGESTGKARLGTRLHWHKITYFY